MLQLRVEGMSLRKIATRMNAGGRVTFRRGKPWDGTLVMRLLEGATGVIGWKPAPEATRTDRTRPSLPPNPFYDNVIPTLLQLREEGLSLRKIADRMNADGRVNFRGKPWRAELVMRLLEGATGVVGWRPGQASTR